MPTIFCDAIEHAGPPLVSRKSYRELLEDDFEPEAEFYLNEGVPYIHYCNWDYAEDWGAAQMREVHPLVPIVRGTRISEAEFRARVRQVHGL